MKHHCLLFAPALSLAGRAQYAAIGQTAPQFTPVRSKSDALPNAQAEIVEAMKRGRRDPLAPSMGSADPYVPPAKGAAKPKMILPTPPPND